MIQWIFGAFGEMVKEVSAPTSLPTAVGSIMIRFVVECCS